MKDWLPDVEAHVARWQARLKKEGRGWWPRYLYHYTDVTNAINVLNTGFLYSRADAQKRKLMRNDNANPDIINRTHPDHLRFVRLYFRPRTPTQYVNEGIKPPQERKNGHCPVPVFFLFDLVKVVGRDDTRFSRGTLASHRHGHSEARHYFVNDIPWRDVYGDGVPPTDSVKRARAAEVVVPDRLPLRSALKGILCRSPAERVTLLDGLRDDVGANWARRIRTGFADCFVGRQPYIVNVSGREGRFLDVTFSKALDRRRGKVEASFYGPRDEGQWSGQFENRKRMTFNLRRKHARACVTVYMEDCLAFRGDVVIDDLPF